MGDSNGRRQFRLLLSLFFGSLNRVIDTKTDIDERPAYVTNTVGVLQPTFTIQACRVIDLNGDAIDELLHSQWP